MAGAQFCQRKHVGKVCISRAQQYSRALYDVETKVLEKVRKMMASAKFCQRKPDGKKVLHACTAVLARIKDLKSGAKH